LQLDPEAGQTPVRWELWVNSARAVPRWDVG